MWHVLGILVHTMVLLIAYETVLTPSLLKASEDSFNGSGIIDKLVIIQTEEELDNQDNQTAWGVWEGEGRFEDVFSGSHQHPLGLGEEIDNIFLHTDINYYFGKFRSSTSETGRWISYNGNDLCKAVPNIDVGGSFNKKIILIQLEDLFTDKEINFKNMSSVKIKIEDLFHFDNKTCYILLRRGHGTKQIVLWGQGAGKGRQDKIQQEDIAPLMAGLLGIQIPRESRGHVPLPYLNISEQNVAKLLAQNGLQLSKICLATTNYFHKGFLFRQFTRLTLTNCAFDDYKIELMNLQQQGDYGNMKTFGNDIIYSGHECITQFQIFYRAVLIIIGYLTITPWCIILLALVKVQSNNIQSWYYLSCILHISFTIVALGTSYIVLYTEWPYYYIFYFTFPILLWWIALLLSDQWTQYLKQYNIYVLIALFFTITVSVELIYWTWNYKYLAALFFIPYCGYLAFSQSNRVPFYIVLLWLGSIPILLASYETDLPHSFIGISLSSGVWFVVSLFAIYFTRKDYFALTTSLSLGLLLLLTSFVIYFFFLSNSPMPLDTVRGVSWWLLLAPLLAYFGTNVLSTRIILLCVASAIPFLLLSVGYEPIFFLIFCFNLYSWLELEISGKEYVDQGITGGLCIYFLCFVGNEISDINPNSEVFLHSKSKFITFALIHYKTFLPIFLVCSSSAALFTTRGFPIQNPQLVTLVLAAHTSIRQLMGILMNDISLDTIMKTFVFTIKLLIAFTISPIIVRNTELEYLQKNKVSKVS